MILTIIQGIAVFALIVVLASIATAHYWKRWQTTILEKYVRRAAKTHTQTSAAICLICTNVKLEWHISMPPCARLWCGYKQDGDYSPLTGKKNELTDALLRNPSGECPKFTKDYESLRLYGAEGRLP